MIAPLLAFVQLFAIGDPAACLIDLQQMHSHTTDVWDSDPRALLDSAVSQNCRYESVRIGYMRGASRSSLIEVTIDFPSFVSDATVTNHGSGLVASQKD